jgi:stage II sporulation protein E
MGGAAVNVEQKQYKKKHRRQKLPQIASSAYSGSEERCGDNCGWGLLSDGKLAVALSDGMGKGELAACESERAVNSILPLLKAGMDAEMALQVLNLLWAMSNRKEQFPTMDLALLDSVNRELVIYKVGAAPTVVVRAPRCRPGPIVSEPPEHIEILAAPAMPMGAAECSEIASVSTLVMPGDRIIMMTDGILDSNRDDLELKWLRRLLTRIKSRNLQIVCDLIIREAALNYGAEEKDDMTVVIFDVK